MPLQAHLPENLAIDRRPRLQTVNNESLLCIRDELPAEHKHLYHYRSNISAACRLD